MKSLSAADENTDLSLVLKVLDENHTIPVVVLDNDGGCNRNTVILLLKRVMQRIALITLLLWVNS